MTPAGWHIAVLIPAHNEETLLPRCLDSVLAAAAALPRHIACDVVVAVDSSIDRTRAIAEQMLAGRGAVALCHSRAVGCARAAAAHAALQRYRGPRAQCWLANTDADCLVPESWLLDQLALAAEGAEAIAGTVGIDTFEEHKACVAELFRLTYLIHPDGSHPHVHGANLGVRADAYLRAGGWHELATAEDHDLWLRLLQMGARVVSTATVRVLTSGRRQGRAPQGFAERLAAHNGAAV